MDTWLHIHNSILQVEHRVLQSDKGAQVESELVDYWVTVNLHLHYYMRCHPIQLAIDKPSMVCVVVRRGVKAR